MHSYCYVIPVHRQKHLTLELFFWVRLHLLCRRELKLEGVAKMKTEASTKEQVLLLLLMTQVS